MPKATASRAALSFEAGPRGLSRITHDWPTQAAECRAIQQALRAHVTTTPLVGPIRTIAGVDIGFEDRGRTTRAAVVALDADTREEIEQALVRLPTRMPYLPGLLSFREVPAALTALAELSSLPDLLMVDGHGIAHPRRLGNATHLGLASGLPSIGVAKKRLTGKHEVVPDTRLAHVPLVEADETIGAVLRSREGVKPIFISPGYGCNLDDALAWSIAMLGRYRLPETTRSADRIASRRGRRFSA